MTSSPYENPQDPSQQPGQQPGHTPYPQQGPDTGSKFGTSPYDPHAVGAPMPEPQKFTLLKKLTLASLAIYLLSAVLSVASAMDDQLIREQLEASGMAVDDAMVSNAVVMGLIFAVVLTAVALVIYLVVYLGITKVKNWGRILGVVFGAIGTIMTAAGLLNVGMMLDQGAVGILSLLISVAFVMVNIYWFITAFNKDVSAYFRQGRPAV